MTSEAADARPAVAVVVGTRPDAIKLLPLVARLRDGYPQLRTLVVSTGQHREMLGQVLDVFGVRADHDLGLMQPGQTPTEVAGRALIAFGELLGRIDPRIVVVQGDTTTAFACGLATYLHGGRTLLAHVEAGLRTNDKRSPFPEEINRRLLGPIADLHFPPTERAREALLAEGVAPGAVLVTGNTVIDALLAIAGRDAPPPPGLGLERVALEGGRKTVLVTLHRRESFGEGHARAFAALARVARAHADDVQIVFPVHLNPSVREPALEALRGVPNVHLLEPLAYDAFIYVLKRAHAVVTDSGGIQEEAPSLRVPVLVVRENTERPEAVAAGAAVVVGTDPDRIAAKLEELLAGGAAYEAMRPGKNPYGDGLASERIAAALARAAGVDAPAAAPWVYGG